MTLALIHHTPYLPGLIGLALVPFMFTAVIGLHALANRLEGRRVWR